MKQSPEQISAMLVSGDQRKVIWTVDVAAVITTQNRTLAAHENHLEVTLSATGATASTLTMPDVGEAAGQEYFIYLKTANANTLTLSFPGSPSVFILAGTAWGNANLTADADCILLWSNGVVWFMFIDLTT